MYLKIEIMWIALLSALSIFLLWRNNVFKKKDSIKEFIVKNKTGIATVLLFIILFSVRILYIEKIPYGINRDEASAGYDAWNILKYGVDRHNTPYPVYFESWGGGQNALYTYILIPFVYMLGLSVFSVRLPMAIISSISLIYFYLTLKNRFNNKKALLGTFILGIAPYMIMKSRWGLESNLLPELIILMYYNFDKYLIDKKKLNFYSFFAIAGIACYSYATAFMIMPVLMITMMIYFVWFRKIVSLKDMLKGILLTALISFPLILFTLTNQFRWGNISFGMFTVPMLENNRGMAMFNTDNLLSKVTEAFKFIFTDYDIGYYNKMSFFNLYYPILYLVFIIYGALFIIKELKNKNTTFDLLLCMFIPSIVLMIFSQPNVNRLNFAIMTVMLLLPYGGIYFCYRPYEEKKMFKTIYSLTALGMIIFFGGFIYLYPKEYKYPSYHNSLFSDAVYKVSKESLKNNKKIYMVDNSIHNQYIYYLFATKTSPEILLKNSKTSESPLGEKENYEMINDKYFNQNVLLLRKNCYYVVDIFSEEQLKSLKKNLTGAKIKYKQSKIDYFYIIET